MKKILKIAVAIFPIISVTSITASCAKSDLNTNQVHFVFDNKVFTNRSAAQNYARSLVKPYKENDTEFLSYKGQVYKDYESEKMYEEIISDYPITLKSTLQTFDNLHFDSTNKIEGELYDLENSKVVKTYRDANGKAVLNKNDAINSYLLTSKWYQNQDNTKEPFEFKYQLQNFLYNTKKEELKKGIQTNCYSISNGVCGSKYDVTDLIKKETTKKFNFGKYTWSNREIPDFKNFDNDLIQKYIDKYIRESKDNLNGYILNFNSYRQNFFGDRIIFTEIGEDSMRSKLNNWELVKSEPVNQVFSKIMIQSQLLNFIADLTANHNSANKNWNTFNDIFHGDIEKYNNFSEIYDQVSSSKWNSNNIYDFFNREQEETKIENFEILNNKHKSLIFLKKIMNQVELSTNIYNEKNMEKFEKIFKETIIDVLTSDLPKEMEKPVKMLFNNEKFLSIDLIDLMLTPSLFNNKMKNKLNLDDYIKGISDLINGFINLVDEIPGADEIPVVKEILKAWKITQNFSFFENKLMKIDFGNNQVIYFKGNDVKIPVVNYSLNFNNPSNYIESKQFLEAKNFNNTENGYTFLNTLHSTKELAINALKNYIISYPEKFKEVEAELKYSINDSPKMIVSNESLNNLDEKLNEYANKIFDLNIDKYKKTTFTNGFGQIFPDKESALESLNKNLLTENFQYLLKPVSKMLYETYYENNKQFMDENLEYIKNVLAKEKYVLSNELLLSSNFDELKSNPNVINSYYQIYLDGRLINFKTYDDAKYYLVRNLKISKGIYNTDENFIIYQNHIFRNIIDFDKFVDNDIKEIKKEENHEQV
ncbi:hypothetical protein SSABA_v1c04440 [Spiroplasma sabaudiense Ar-1343]|uniref:Lipoprotein n=1 Tax=Spiroplasma sabaudiense Ar-1343 TaxID=1276257 RepID=W6AA29_9MOLU|nr:hypothetical protein [Spiroplasma sabaudiense]AHI53851.1 hypothetical protein SSABA_v1c04440 [Spiroplasma sabaudiense Ar-1343]